VSGNAGFVAQEILDRVPVGREYVAARYGFRNHWYPALLSGDLAELQVRPIQLLGERILLKRIRGRVFGIRDRCLHRGVALSRKIQCFTPDTISCWYHGFTYRFEDGLLCDILGAPQSRAVGRKTIRTYPVQEAKGLIFVFVGDAHVTLPPLREDVPPGFLDEDLAVRGMWREVGSNWRIGAENGFDSTHIFIHRESPLIRNADLALPLGLVPRGRASFRTVEEPGGPKGVYDLFDPEHVTPVFKATVGGQTVLEANSDAANKLPHHISIWMPGALCVHPWPVPEITQYEWYVPIDGDRHIYVQALGKRVSDPRDELRFGEDFDARWRPIALQAFNDDDVWAREATHPFYADDTGWLREQLFEADGNILEWRKLASRHNRGIQAPEHL
jgi:carbazole 1,9a-dioxygenase